jgi:ribonuclease J
VPADAIVLAENGSVVEVDRNGARLVDRVEGGMTFVDGLSVGDISDVALRDRRRLSEDGVLIIVATLTSQNGRVSARPELIARGFADSEPLLDEMRAEAERVLDECLREQIVEIKLLQEHLHDGVGQLVYDRVGKRPLILPVVVEV